MNLSKSKYLKIGSGIHPSLRRLRGKCFVYFLLRGDKVVYIGCTEDIQQRISVHKSGLWVKRWFTHCRIIQCKSYHKMISYEKRWIAKFDPKYNGVKKPSGSNMPYNEWATRRGFPLIEATLENNF